MSVRWGINPKRLGTAELQRWVNVIMPAPTIMESQQGGIISRSCQVEKNGADMGTTHFLFHSTQYQKALIRLNSWLTMVFQKLIQISSWLKMDFWNSIQIDSRLQNLPEYFDSNKLTTQKTFQNFNSYRLMTQTIWNIDSNEVMTQWFESTVDFVDLLWAFTKFRWPF